MQWFRFYTEAVSDKKLRRIARDNNESMAHVLGVWTIVLSIASDSPIRGRLLISDDVPATIDDINDAAGCNVTATFQKLFVTGLVTAAVTDDGKTVYEVPAWDKRQFESDSSATRVRRHRERKKDAQKPANVTEVKRYSNAPDTDTDTESDTENKPLAGARGLNGFDNGYGSRQQRASYHTAEAQKLGVEPEAFRVIVDKLIDTAGWRALIDAGQNERKLTAAKDAALELVRMAVTTPEQVNTLVEAYRAVNDWRKTPPTPQALSEYASQIADKLKPKPKKTVWVLDANGNRMHEAQI